MASSSFEIVKLYFAAWNVRGESTLSYLCYKMVLSVAVQKTG